MKLLDEKKLRAAGQAMKLQAIGQAVIQLVQAGQTLDVAALQDHLRGQLDRSPAVDLARYSFEAALAEIQVALDATERKSL